MTRVLIYIALLAALALAGAWLVEQPGEVAVMLPGHAKITTSLLGAGAAVLAVVVAAVLLWTLVRLVLRLPTLVSLSSRARRRTRGFAAISRGMVAVGSGDPRQARRHAEDAARLLGREPLALLLKAQAAQMAGDRGTAEGTFRQMLDEPETRVLGLRGLFVEARRKGDAAAARAYAAEATRIAPAVAWAGEALLEYQCADRDWKGALATLDRGARGLDKAVVARQRAVLLTADAMQRTEGETDAALASVREALKLAPGLIPAATLAGRLLARRGDMRKAAKLIEQAWARQTHPDLATAYVGIRPGDSARDRLARAERLLSLRPSDAEGRIAVATAALAAREFKRSRAVLAPLLLEQPSVRVCLLMADIEEWENSDSGAVREWLGRASRAPRDPAWIADGVITDQWAPTSPVTGRLDAFVWGQPIESLAAPAPRPRPVPLPPENALLAPATEAPAATLAAPVDPAQEPPAAVAAGASSPPLQKIPAPTEPTGVPAQAPAGTAHPAPVPDGPRAAPEEPRSAIVPDAPAAELHPAGGQRAATVPILALATSPAPARDTGRRARGAPSEVIFPLPTPPDDPGPDRADTPTHGRSGFLQ
jgi:HemY protein